MAAGVETAIEAFRHLRGEEQVHLLIAGESAGLAHGVAGGRTSFCTPWPTEETSLILRSADVLVLPTRGDQSLVSAPTKLPYYMLSARPVLALALPDSDTAQLVERSGCGWVIEPGQPEVLAAKIREIARVDSNELERLGQKGRRFVMQNLSRESCLPAVIDLLESTLSVA